ncbi:hypothetical protein MNBD_IGNAVI01-395 [hydrothermal vent metagenome]|uniref:CopG family transcriptional regulator n=1 Tax=hydrothermal vent metagenome TaxID=652676 RepID=A0A3B1CZL7_9ZZZZ
METTKRATIYLNQRLHKALKMKAAETDTTISDLVNISIKEMLMEDEEDLQTFKDRVDEPTITYEKLLADLKRDKKI